MEDAVIFEYEFAFNSYPPLFKKRVANLLDERLTTLVR